MVLGRETLEAYAKEDIRSMLRENEAKLFDRVNLSGQSDIAKAYELMPRHAFRNWISGFLKGALADLSPLNIKIGRR